VKANEKFFREFYGKVFAAASYGQPYSNGKDVAEFEMDLTSLPGCKYGPSFRSFAFQLFLGYGMSRNRDI
jgi:hypothetical protein